MDQTLSDFGAVFVFLLLGTVFVVGGYLTARLLRPSRPNPEKLAVYECGEDAVGTSWVKFNIRFYVVALIFIIFDVEVVFLFPWATVFKQLGEFALIEALVFAGILIIGLAYAWVKGDLDWVRPTPNIPSMPQPPQKEK
ncbi:MAG: NADH-quinone oxidoreductase subunit A [Prosthecochloris sp.]|uniref:NADH-quinone oxidoreductase subunit A n=1 Tax=Prosthecochloris aestuarii (strain DSM 271 / SK 413) TaxID=290512 RepID=NUOA_PROA2|nr:MULTISPECIES: NADH-quinone oxidoreductase subunit A [Prosthecochloris]B4S751.1 RecName: Full=NADH-quinone oxidoreductase subunit A; AltName: Full=NADH dehydrogenase I subunit A; AltName: Full=NDH-1 subunit A; AltName: Full=NUO1 [Prosthecochloris aestuarii DSM 271]ACF45888.1 NADH-ubiquinone/plastoquinone oxidoreductase chain 3 [Prosthecochloris aestuarii DSM 271]MCW8799209.1 NADH-quinone oxidoreductase subunit A [Prosthecochloris sp.]NEX11391.1 NADH-quinone oxidoreductase subunit A [Prostheco